MTDRGRAPVTGGLRRSPIVERRHLARRLELARRESGHTQATAARALGWSPRKQALLEAGDQVISSRDLDAVLPGLAVPAEEWPDWRERVAFARSKGWWDAYGDEDLSLAAKFYVGCEHGTVRLRSFQNVVVPGLLQTAAYREALLRRGALTPRPEEQLAAMLRASHQRWRLLGEPDPIEVRAVLDEVVLHRPMGPPAVMGAQIAHLADLADHRPHVTVQVVPLGTGPYPSFTSAFAIHDLGDDESFVHREHAPDRTIYLEERADVYLYSQVFERLTEVALSPSDSIQMLRDMERASRTSVPVRS